MSRRIFIHIGTHKTGTTSIQAMLHSLAPRLGAAGIHVPCVGCPYPGFRGHHNIGWLLREDSRADPNLGGAEELGKELRTTTAHTAVISAEGLEYLTDRPALIQLLEAPLHDAGWEPVYLVFLRDPASYALSMYHEFLKSGTDVPFRSFVDTIVRRGTYPMPGGRTLFFDHEAMLDRWRAASHARIRVLSYNRANETMGIMAAFLDEIGAPEEISRPYRRIRDDSNTEGLLHRLAVYLRKASSAVRTSGPYFNRNTRPITPDMREHAAKVEARFSAGFSRLAGRYIQGHADTKRRAYRYTYIEAMATTGTKPANRQTCRRPAPLFPSLKRG